VDDRVTLILWTAGGAIFLGLVGGLFGALAGLLARTSGNAPGGWIGPRVLNAVERMLQADLTPAQAGALVGGCDGASFLGAVGCLLGLAAGSSEWFPHDALFAVFAAIAGLALLAIHFGLLAYGFLRAGIRTVGGASLGAVAGVFLGAWLIPGPGIFIGGEVGALGGLAASVMTRRHVKTTKPLAPALRERGERAEP
jgi:hypothetical protein